MKSRPIFPALILVAAAVCHASPGWAEEADNKRLARAFYENLWFSENTDRYADYVAEEYVVHDIGEDKNLTESAMEQKRIADFFWSMGDMGGEIDYQIAEGDLVATRWQWHFVPDTLRGHLMMGETRIPIINVFRFRDGKIVEIWNHRHDIDTGLTRIHFVKGLLAGLLFALALAVYAWRLRRKLKRAYRGEGSLPSYQGERAP